MVIIKHYCDLCEKEIINSDSGIVDLDFRKLQCLNSDKLEVCGDCALKINNYIKNLKIGDEE